MIVNKLLNCKEQQQTERKKDFSYYILFIRNIVYDLLSHQQWRRGGLTITALVSAHLVVRVRVQTGDIVLCSWARHYIPIVSLSTQVYKLSIGELIAGGNPAMC